MFTFEEAFPQPNFQAQYRASSCLFHGLPLPALIGYAELNAPLLRMNKGTLGVPFEVLAYIFLIECPALSSNSDGHKAVDPLSYLARMGSVCQQWRQVVLQTPRLWSTVHYLLDVNRAAYGPEKWQTILKRSGDMDLAVCIWHQDTPWCEVGFPEERLVGDRISLFHILRRARIIIIHNTSCHDGYQFIPNWTITFVPRLQHLIVYTDHPPVRDILLLPVALQSMSYSTPYELDAVERKCITQCSPKRLSLRINSLEGILLDMLESLAYLKELSLKYNIERHSRPFSHSNLIHLTITSKHVSPSRILGALPNLIHLKLCPRRPGTNQESDHRLVVPRALPPLTALRSLTVEPEAPQYRYVHDITTVVDRAPALIALEVWDENALEVVSRFAGVAIGPQPELTDAAEDASSYLRAPML